TESTRDPAIPPVTTAIHEIPHPASIAPAAAETAPASDAMLPGSETAPDVPVGTLFPDVMSRGLAAASVPISVAQVSAAAAASAPIATARKRRSCEKTEASAAIP